MSQSPTEDTNKPEQDYLDAWQDLAVRIRHGNSFSGREPNSAFLNTRGDRFADLSMMSGLGLIDDARAVAVTDWDRDGDLDLWVSNRNGPRLRLLRNDYSADAPSLAIQLQGDPEKRCPRDAIGAVVTMNLSDGKRVVRHLAAGDGFLSQSSKWLHFGLDGARKAVSLSVRWPSDDGGTDETFAVAGPGRWHLRQGSGRALPVKTSVAELPLAELVLPEPDAKAHVILTDPREAPELAYRQWTGEPALIDTESLTLTVLWASWCQPCLQEMAALAKAQPALERAGINVIALNIEEVHAAGQGETPSVEFLRQTLSKTGWPYASGRASASLLEALDTAQRAVLYKQDPLPLPSSFLWYGGNLVSFTKGALSIEALLGESARLAKAPEEHPDHAVPFAGRWSTKHFVTNPVAIARVYLADGYTEAARQYLHDSMAKLAKENDARIRSLQEADIQHMLGETYRLENAAPEVALPFYEKALQLHPQHRSALLSYARALAAAKRAKEAVPVLRRYLEQQPERHDVALQLGDIYQGLGMDRDAVALYQSVIEAKPDDFHALNQLCWVYATSADSGLRDSNKALPLAEKILRQFPGNVYALDSAAAALAGAGQYDQAVQLAQRALATARNRGDERLSKEISERLRLYENKKPFVRTAG